MLVTALAAVSCDGFAIPAQGPQHRRRTNPRYLKRNGDVGDDTCVIGGNVVDQCEVSVTGDQSQNSAAINLSKCICGAGSFALPHVFLEEGVLGGTLAITLCGALAAIQFLLFVYVWPISFVWLVPNLLCLY